jgi:hypothetical protein
VVVIVAVATGGPTRAANPPVTYLVPPGAADANGSCNSTTSVCTTLRAAVGAATAGDTIQLAPGVYALNSQLQPKGGVTIRGAAMPPGPAATTIQLSKSRAFTISSGAVALDGVVIDGGSEGKTGGAILVAQGAELALKRSTVRNSRASEGGGIDNQGTLRLTQSTIANNNATKGKGGGILSGGTLTAVNSTIASNQASQGGGISISGTAQLEHVTVVGNSAINSAGGGAQRIGGTLQLRNSIIANNLAKDAAGRDCSGTPELIGLNLVSVLQGCNPIGQVIVADPLLGPLQDNGGATRTMSPGDGSQAIDALQSPHTCGQTVDQRATTRPAGAACDLGAVERQSLGLALSLAADPAVVGPGAAAVPANDAFSALVGGAGGTPTGPDTTGLASIGLASIGLASITIEDLGLASIGLHSIGLHSIGLHSIGLASIGLHSIGLASIGLHSIGLHSILLSDAPLLQEGGWEAYLAGTPYEGLPLQSVTLADVLELRGTPEVTLADLDLSATGLASIGLHSILLADVGLASIPLDPTLVDANDAEREAAWCALLGPDICAVLAADGANDFSLLSLDLLDAEKPQVPLDTIPLSGLSVADLNPAGLHSIGLHSIGLASIRLQNTGLASIGLASIGLASIDTIVDCDKIDCASTTATLGDAEAAGAIWPECSMNGDGPDATPIRGCIGNLLNLEELLAGYSLGDLLLGFLSPEDLPWQTLDLDNTLLQNIANPQEPVFRYVATVEVTGSPAGALDVSLQLPEGFSYAANLPVSGGHPSLQAPPATFDGAAVAETSDSLTNLTFHLENVSTGVHTLSVAVRAGLTLGDFTASASAAAQSAGESASAGPAEATVTVTDAAESGGTVLMTSGDLNLAHMSRSGDVDLYSFTVPNDSSLRGSVAKILLSNLPADYDLVVYAPAFASLRGDPEQRMAAIDEYTVGLAPSADAFAADVAQDIPLEPPAGTAVAAVSSRRGQADDEVTIASLVPGATYYVQVSSYNGTLSNKPYALRMSLLGGAPLPVCGPRQFPNAMPGAADQPTIPDGVNTLFITNLQWLNASFGSTAASEITDAVAAVNGVADVNSALVPVDAYGPVQSAYSGWAVDPCNPDARNEVVRSIGAVLDGLLASHPDIQYLVIVGDDGVVPMAALPDRTVLSNERTFAQEFDGTNELVSTLANSMFLSDDPYATVRGRQVRNAELYVPDLAVGRLVETPTEIITSLTNFVAYDGQLDATTAAVAGYDFLSDGATQAAGSLVDSGYSVDTSLIRDNWTAGDLSAVIQAGPDVFSPNAHYDWEDLLPADQNLVGTFDSLFDVGDLQAVGNQLSGAVVFTAGCHAGLSVSDIQLGLTATDWAQTYLGLGNLFIGHTTFGYGDSDLVALSERLVALYAENVGSMTAGEALLYAKQQYLATTPILNPYDEKVLQSLTFYGLPMFRSGGDVTASASTRSLQTESQALDAPGVTFGPGNALRLDLQVGSSSAPAVLHQVNGSDGNYFEVDGQTLTAQHRPVQPRADIELTGTNAAGFLITSLSSFDIPGFEPLYFRPRVDLSGHEPRLSPGEASFPAQLSALSTYETPEGQRQNLMLIPGQYQSMDDLERLFTSIGGEVLERPAGSTDVTPAQIVQSIGRVGDGAVSFEIHTDPTATRVYVLFKEGGTNTSPRNWRGAELARTPGTDIWVGGAVLTAGVSGMVEFMVQATDSAGNVSMSNNKAEGFEVATPIETGNISIEIMSSGDAVNGHYKSPVTVTITGATHYSIDAAPFQSYNGPFQVTGSGGHMITAIDGAGGIAYYFFVIDDDAPGITAGVVPDLGTGWASPPVTVRIKATDVGPAGVESITWQASGAQSGSATVNGDTAEIIVNAEGVTTFTIFATDLAGNESGATTFVVQADGSDPTVTCPAAPTTWFASEPTIDCTVTDTGSGVASGTVTLQVQPVPAGTETTNATTNTVEVCDLAGNCVQAGPVSGFRVDKKAPDIQVVTPAEGGTYTPGQVVALDYTCSDGGSGVAVPCGSPAPGALLDTATTGSKSITITAQDAAGNVATLTINYTVGYRVCLQYDPDSVTMVGAVVAIKLYLCDETGAEVPSDDLKLLAVSVDEELAPGPNDAGTANARFEFRDVGFGYIYNLDTDFLTAGPHTLDFIVLDGTNRHCAKLDPGNDAGEVGSCTTVYQAPFTLG